MREIIFDNPHQKKHFDFFNEMNHPHFNIAANVDITQLQQTIQEQEISFTSAVLFLVCHTANAIPEFRWRIRGGKVVEHDAVHPSFTVPTNISEAFSFCHFNYSPSFKSFSKAFAGAKKEMEHNPSFVDESGRDDFLFVSALPWVSFTMCQHAMPYHPTDSVPRITWGKFFSENGIVKMPLSIQGHHAVLDGRLMGKYFSLIQEMVNEFKG